MGVGKTVTKNNAFQNRKLNMFNLCQKLSSAEVNYKQRKIEVVSQNHTVQECSIQIYAEWTMIARRNYKFVEFRTWRLSEDCMKLNEYNVTVKFVPIDKQ